MEIVFFMAWGIGTLWCVIVMPISNQVEKLDDSSRFKKWWKKHIADWDPYNKLK
jgi:hypothetical protein